MTWDLAWLEVIDQRIREARERVVAAGTIVDRGTGTNYDSAMCIFDGSALAVPVKVFAGVGALEGARVGLIRFGSDWVVAGVFGILETKSTSDGTDILGYTDTTYVQGSPVCGISFVAPPSGSALVIWRARFEATTAVRANVSVAVRNGAALGAGNSFQPSSDSRCIETPSNARLEAANYTRIAGLTPGEEYNVVTEHRLQAAGTGNIFDRAVAVIPTA